MPVTVARLRRWFGIAAITLVVVVAGFYYYGRIHMRRVVEQSRTQLGVGVQQSSQGFSLSKSEGGHTLFTVRAAQAVQYKESGRAELRNVNIVVYGRESNRFDQIYGDDFVYDPQSQTVAAQGIVHIDLEANSEGTTQPDQAPPQELKNPIHLKTSGLVFNQKTGLAHTDQQIEFRIPQASGTAVGAGYDSRSNTMILESDVRMRADGPSPADINATHGVITKDPRRALLDHVHVVRSGGTMEADHLTVYLRNDNSIDHMVATGNVRSSRSGASTMTATASRADLNLNQRNVLRSAALAGGVALEVAGERPMQGRAGRVLIDFGPANKAEKVHALENVRLVQTPASGRPGAQPQTVQIDADAMDFLVKNGALLERAETSGAAKILLTQPAAQGQPETQTAVTAGKFEATFGEQNRLQTVTGSPNSQIVSMAPGQPNRVSTSRLLHVQFNPAGEITGMVQEGDFHYVDGQRSAWAERASYAPADQNLILTGSPRVVETGLTTTADTLHFNRRTGDAGAQGDVKTTYSDLKPQPNGALLATSDPVHITAQSMTAARAGGTARYSGDARLWQGANIVQAPTIDCDRERRTVVALGGVGRVSTVFVQQGKNGKTTPVNVTSKRLDYTDGQRIARFQGGVVMKGADAIVTADRVDVFLRPRTQNGALIGPSQVDHAIAEGHVLIQEPNRRAQGEKLVYTAAQEKFVLTGGPPSIFDAEHGKTTGDSLTFFSRDDRVLVEGKTSPTVTQVRVAK